MTPVRALLLALVLLVGSAPAAFAHKMKVFAAAEGDRISGYAYFGGGGRAIGARVLAEADGAPVYAGVTDAEGRFAFPVSKRADHRITVDGSDGHVGETVVAAAELPEAAASAAAPTTADLEALIERAVARQVRPLREQLDAYEEKVRWHDVLGGLGVIAGVAGLWYGLAMRRGAITRRSSPAPRQD